MADLLPVTLGSVLITGAFALLAHRRTGLVAAMSAVPVAALLIPATGQRLRALWVGSRIPETADALRVSLPGLLAVVPAAVVFALSFWTSMLAPRAFLMFVPYLLVMVAVDFVRLARTRAAAVLLGLALAAFHFVGVQHFRAYPSEQIDYATLGREMNTRMNEGDLIFLLPELWVYTPVFYYIDADRPRYVAADYAEAVRSYPDARSGCSISTACSGAPTGRQALRWRPPSAGSNCGRK